MGRPDYLMPWIVVCVIDIVLCFGLIIYYIVGSESTWVFTYTIGFVLEVYSLMIVLNFREQAWGEQFVEPNVSRV